MRSGDVLRFSLGALQGNRVRTILMLLAMSIAVAAVVLLTAVGEGARLFVVNEFASLGTNLLIVLPGRAETAGIGPSSFMGGHRATSLFGIPWHWRATLQSGA